MRPQYWVAWVAALLFFGSFYALLAPLPLYLAQLGLPDWQIAAILGTFGIASLAGRPGAGVLSDRFGARRVMVLGAVLLAGGAAAMGVVRALPLLFICRVAHALGYVAFTTASTMLVSVMSSAYARGGALALFGVAANVAMMVTPAAIDASLGGLTLGGVFVLSGVLALAAGGCALTLPGPASLKARPTTADKPDCAERLSHLAQTAAGVGGRTGRGAQWRDSFRVPRPLRTPLAAALLYGVGFGAFLQFLPVLAERRHLGTPGLGYTAYGCGIIVSRVVFGRHLDGPHRRSLLRIASLVLGCGLAALAVAPARGWMVPAAALVALGSGILHPGLIATSVDRLPLAQAGRATASFYFGFDAGIGLSAWALAPALQWFGIETLFLAAAACAALAIVFIDRPVDRRASL